MAVTCKLNRSRDKISSNLCRQPLNAVSLSKDATNNLSLASWKLCEPQEEFDKILRWKRNTRREMRLKRDKTASETKENTQGPKTLEMERG
jgi:hypothetical protein